MVKIRCWMAWNEIVGGEKRKTPLTWVSLSVYPTPLSLRVPVFKMGMTFTQQVPERISNELLIKRDSDTRLDAGKDVINKGTNTHL